MLLLACSCNFLKVDNIGKSTIESYFAEISSLEPAVNGLYNLTDRKSTRLNSSHTS